MASRDSFFRLPLDLGRGPLFDYRWPVNQTILPWQITQTNPFGMTMWAFATGTPHHLGRVMQHKRWAVGIPLMSMRAAVHSFDSSNGWPGYNFMFMLSLENLENVRDGTSATKTHKTLEFIRFLKQGFYWYTMLFAHWIGLYPSGSWRDQAHLTYLGLKTGANFVCGSLRMWPYDDILLAPKFVI